MGGLPARLSRPPQWKGQGTMNQVHIYSAELELRVFCLVTFIWAQQPNGLSGPVHRVLYLLQ